MKNQYFLSYADPVPINEVNCIFIAEDFPVEVIEVFPHSFLLGSNLAYSKIKYALESYYAEKQTLKSYIVMKIKEGSAEAIAPRGKE